MSSNEYVFSVQVYESPGHVIQAHDLENSTYRAANRFSLSSAIVILIPFCLGRETKACLPRPMTKMLLNLVAKVAPEASLKYCHAIVKMIQERFKFCEKFYDFSSTRKLAR